MLQALRFSNATHQMLVRVQGELQAQRGKRLTFDDVIQLLVHEHDGVTRRRQPETSARP